MSLLSRFRQRGPTNPREAETNAWIRHLMIGIAANPFALTEVVASGPTAFINQFLREGRGLAIDRHVALKVYAFFCQKVVDRFGPKGPAYLAANPAELGRVLAKEFLDKVEVQSPPTEAEIEASWVHEVADSEDAKRRFYKDGRNPDLPSKPIIVH